jgi:hypothetical protein
MCPVEYCPYFTELYFDRNASVFVFNDKLTQQHDGKKDISLDINQAIFLIFRKIIGRL